MVEVGSNPMDSSEASRLVQLAASGDDQAWERLLTDFRPRLRRMVGLRLDRRLQGRVDPSDVIQEAFLDAARRLSEFAKNPTMPFYLWLRFLAGQRLLEQHRRHLGTKARDAGREISLYRGAFPATTTADLAAQFLGKLSAPSQAVVKIEQKIRLQEALNSLDPIDREILALRHFEQLSNVEAAEVLGLEPATAYKRYARALLRLKDVLVSMFGGEEEFAP